MHGKIPVDHTSQGHLGYFWSHKAQNDTHLHPQTILSNWHRITPSDDRETTKMSLCFYLITLYVHNYVFNDATQLCI